MRSAKFLLGIALAAVAGATCGPLRGGDDGFDPERFRDTVEEARRDGLTVYWLGRRFEAGGAAFDEIDPGSWEESAVTHSVDLHYFTGDDEAEFQGTLDISSRRIESGEPPETNPAQFFRVERKEVTIQGHDAELSVIWLRASGPSGYKLLIRMSDAIVVMRTSRMISEDNVDLNPLTDETAFLSVAEQIRPYPD